MTNELFDRPQRLSGGWATRWFPQFGARRPHADLAEQTIPPPAKGSGNLRDLTRRLIADGRSALVLMAQANEDVDEAAALPAWAELAGTMALVPGGVSPIVQADQSLVLAEIPAFYIDRTAVTNRQFQVFLDSGGYENLEIWPTEAWPSVARFVDRTRNAGPRDWGNGRPPPGKADHPVVGVCWFEAVAYATWAGKRLPSSAEWQKAGGWPDHLSGGACLRFPWGDVFEPERANLGSSGAGTTVPVHDYPGGETPNGICQLTGNVWEWLADRLETIPCERGESFAGLRPMRRIVGGAFDTYFPAESTLQFVTGQPDLDRRDNIGFRCAVSVSRLRNRP